MRASNRRTRSEVMSWAIITGAVIFASLVATLILAEWIVRRLRPRKDL